MIELWDDRAVQVETNTGVVIEEALQEAQCKIAAAQAAIQEIERELVERALVGDSIGILRRLSGGEVNGWLAKIGGALK